jgi:hypothetical protein
MNKRNLQNEELDRVGRKLLDAARVRSEEIEQIVGSPMLFDAVKARIETERRNGNLKNVSGGWANLQIWNWQRASAMALPLFIVGVISLIIFSKFTPQQQTEQVAVPEIQPKVAEVEILQPTTQIPEDSPTIVKTKNPVIESPKITKQKVFINKISKTQKSEARKPKQQRRFQLKQNEPSGEFYALTFAGNPGETGEELQIVRAELSRSSLFALGVNLSIENESEKIKTDLLVGADGVARAIRLVNKTENQ